MNYKIGDIVTVSVENEDVKFLGLCTIVSIGKLLIDNKKYMIVYHIKNNITSEIVSIYKSNILKVHNTIAVKNINIFQTPNLKKVAIGDEFTFSDKTKSKVKRISWITESSIYKKQTVKVIFENNESFLLSDLV